jgi:hypothetical protein
MHYSLSQKDEVRLGIGHGAWGIGHRVPWAYLTFLRTAIYAKNPVSRFAFGDSTDYFRQKTVF